MRTTIWLPKSAHTLGKALAKADRRSFSGMLTVLIEKADAGAVNGKAVAS